MTSKTFTPPRQVTQSHGFTEVFLTYNYQYTEQKGFADDISEGKMSLPLIHALGTESPERNHLMSILQQRKKKCALPTSVRKLAVDSIKATGALEYARKTAISLQEAVDETLSQYEDRVGAKNWILRLAQKRLEIQG